MVCEDDQPITEAVIDLKTNEFESNCIDTSKEFLSISGKVEEENTTLEGKFSLVEGQ